MVCPSYNDIMDTIFYLYILKKEPTGDTGGTDRIPPLFTLRRQEREGYRLIFVGLPSILLNPLHGRNAGKLAEAAQDVPSGGGWEMRSGIRQGLQPEMRQEMWSGMRQEMQPEMRQGMRSGIRQEIQPEMRQGMQPEMRQEMRSGIRQGLQPEIQQEMQPDIQQVSQAENSGWRLAYKRAVQRLLKPSKKKCLEGRAGHKRQNKQEKQRLGQERRQREQERQRLGRERRQREQERQRLERERLEQERQRLELERRRKVWILELLDYLKPYVKEFPACYSVCEEAVERWLKKEELWEWWQERWTICCFNGYHQKCFAGELLKQVHLAHYLILGFDDFVPELLRERACHMKSLRLILDREPEELEGLLEELYEETGLTAAVQLVERRADRPDSPYYGCRIVCPLPCVILDYSGEPHLISVDVARGSLWLDMDALEAKRRRIEDRNTGILYFSMKKEWKRAART